MIRYKAKLALFSVLLLVGSSVHAQDPCAGSNDSNISQQQRKQYCQAAKDSKDAGETDTIIGGIWGAVTATCTAICAVPMWGQSPWGGAICDAANLGASVTDAAMTKQYASALSSVGMTGMSVMMRGGLKNAAGSNKGRMSACMGAVTAGIQTFMKFSAAKSHAGASDANLRHAASLNSINMPSTGTDPLAPKDAPKGGPSGSGIAANTDPTSACAVAKSSNTNIEAHISCAISNDPRLPAQLRSPNFPKDFEKMTGRSLADFLGGVKDNPAAAIGAASGLDADGSSKVASIMSDINGNYGAAELNSGIYAGGSGGGGQDSGGAAAPDFGELMNGLMAQLNPKAPGEEAPPPGFSAMDVAQMRRSPAQVSEDRSLSIFARVSYRYYYVGKRVLFSQQAPANPVPAGRN